MHFATTRQRKPGDARPVVAAGKLQETRRLISRLTTSICYAPTVRALMRASLGTRRASGAETIGLVPEIAWSG